MKRLEVWWADLGPPAGFRPVVLVSRTEAYSVRSLATVAPVTTRIRSIPVEVALGPEDGLPKPCVVNVDSLVTIPKVCLQERVTRLRGEKAEAIDEALRFALGLKKA